VEFLVPSAMKKNEFSGKSEFFLLVKAGEGCGLGFVARRKKGAVHLGGGKARRGQSVTRKINRFEAYDELLNLRWRRKERPDG